MSKNVFNNHATFISTSAMMFQESHLSASRYAGFILRRLLGVRYCIVHTCLLCYASRIAVYHGCAILLHVRSQTASWGDILVIDTNLNNNE